MSAPAVFHVPPGADFGAAVARGLRARLADDPPEALARTLLIVNTRRTLRGVLAALEAQAGGATWLPRTALADALAELPAAAHLPAPPPPLRRRLTLTRLVEAFLRMRPEFGPPAGAAPLAGSLAQLLDELQRAGATAEGLAAHDPGDLAEHWRLTQEFLQILTTAWPAVLAETWGEGALDPEAHRIAALDAVLADWAARPPAGPVLAAGSTGSRPGTARLLAAVAGLPRGWVVLPGFDPELPADVRAALPETPEHPHHALAALLADMGVDWTDVPPWDPETATPAPARLRLMSRALRPAPVTDRWQAERAEVAAEAGPATEGVRLLEAPDPRAEAAAIALALTEAARDGRTAALVTPDRTLARRVTAQLDRWRVLPDDSAGAPLALTPPGVALGLIAEGLGRPMTAARLAGLLRHPLVGGEGGVRLRHLEHLRRLERRALRGGPLEPSEDQLRAAAPGPRQDGSAHPDRAAFDAWLGWLMDLMRPLADPPPGLADRIALHRATAEALSAGPPPAAVARADGRPPPAGGDPDAPPPIWRETAGEAAHGFLDALAEAAPDYDHGAAEGTPALYAALWTTLIATEEVRPDAQRADDRIRVLGALEARAETADLVVLGGLNEGVWPAMPAPDPWAPRPLRRQLGLPPPELRVGLSAHDFLQAACARTVVLSRSLRADGAPTVASRWLVRLENLLAGAAAGALADARARGRELLRRAEALEMPDGDRQTPEDRPRPRPPVAARPRELPVTDVEVLIRDPYAIYARRILRLRRLDPLGRPPDARDMGSALHAVMERFARATCDAQGRPLPLEGDDLAEALVAAAEAALADTPWPALRRLWAARIRRLAPVFGDGEAARREGAVRLAPEARGRRAFDAPGGEFTLTARADRVDLLAGGEGAIWDWKSGTMPSEAQIEVFAKQLTLAGAILEAGGFEGLPAATPAALGYVSLSGSPTAKRSQAAPADRVAEDWARLADLIEAFDDPATPYAARLRPAHVTHASDYDHLARLGEWGDGPGEDA